MDQKGFSPISLVILILLSLFLLGGIYYFLPKLKNTGAICKGDKDCWGGLTCQKEIKCPANAKCVGDGCPPCKESNICKEKLPPVELTPGGDMKF